MDATSVAFLRRNPHYQYERSTRRCYPMQAVLSDTAKRPDTSDIAGYWGVVRFKLGDFLFFTLFFLSSVLVKWSWAAVALSCTPRVAAQLPS